MGIAERYFASVREASTSLQTLRRRKEREEYARYALGSMTGVRVAATPKDINGTAATIAAIDSEEIINRRMAELAKVIDDALCVLYGEDEQNGVARALGGTYADVIEMRCIECMSWAAIADVTGMCQRTMQEKYRIALDYVDSVGIAGAKMAAIP